MDDAEYLFHQTSYGAKRLARGAFAKKNGSKSKKCTLPSDRLSAKERKELNGKVETYSFNKPMSWKSFKAMPIDLQAKYLRTLTANYNARCKDVAEMFSIHPNYLSTYVDKNNLPLFGKTGKKSADPAWLAFIAPEEPSPADIPEPVPEKKDDPEPPARVKLDVSDTVCRNGLIQYIGKPADVFQRVYEVLDKDDVYYIQVSFLKKENDDATVRT